MDTAMTKHHSKPTATVSERGKVISYMIKKFTAIPGMSLLTNLLINVADVHDAMKYPRTDRGSGVGKNVIESELLGLLPFDRIMETFNSKANDVSETQLAVLNSITSDTSNTDSLQQSPQMNQLQWGNEPFIRQEDQAMPTLTELAQRVWDEHNKDLTQVTQELEAAYIEAEKA
jgi:hypothetical protein